MVNSKTVKVVIVNNIELLRRGLRSVLETYDDIEVVGEGGIGFATVELCRALHPDVVVMDVQLPQVNGIETTRVICKEFPSIGIVILANTVDNAGKAPALRAGAKSYLTKTTKLQTFMDALYAAAQ